MAEITEDKAPLIEPERRVRRVESLLGAILLQMGTIFWVTGLTTLPGWLAWFGIILPIGVSWWVLRLPWPPSLHTIGLYSLFALPATAYVALWFFLDTVTHAPFVWGITILSFPFFYALLLSLSALERYRRVTGHVSRILLSAFAVLTAYVAYTVILLQPALWQGMVLTFVVSFLLLVNALLRWSGSDARRTLFYTSLLSFFLVLIYTCLFFWPMGHLVTALVMMLAYYGLTGVVRHGLRNVLMREVLLEHLLVIIAVLVWVLINTDWRFTI